MIYLDNAATTFPKPAQVMESMTNYMKNYGASPSRGNYSLAIKANKALYNCRKKVAKFFNVKDIERVVFTKNATEAINLTLKGLLKSGDHVVTSSLEHNSVYRCLNVLKKNRGIEYSIVQADEKGVIDAKGFRDNLQSNTKLFVVTHASNLIGTVLPIESIGRIARENDILMMVDCAQSAGHINIDVDRDNIDILCFTGHKGLYGPQGTGGIYISKKVDVEPLLEGGTGGDSSLRSNPNYYPDKLEAGTLNMVGIVGLSSGLDFVNSIGVDAILKHEQKLLLQLCQELSSFSDIKIYGEREMTNNIGIITFNLKNISCIDVGYELDRKFGIMVRTGLHCSPLAHKTIGTIDKGAVRCSLSYFNNEEDIEKLLKAIYYILKGGT